MGKTITVFGSSLPVSGDEEYETAFKLGSHLAEKGFNICTGGYTGIMDAVSKGAVGKGSEATGITLTYRRSNISMYLTREEKCDSLFERLTKLIEHGDGFVALKGGTGTLLELAAIWEMMNKGIIPLKPSACHSLMWEQVIEIMERQIKTEKRETGLIKVFRSTDEIVDYFVKEFLI